jgi:multidrug resistance protein
MFLLTIPVSGFASNIYFPALSTIADNLNVSVELVNLTVTSYLIFQGLAPSLWGPISDRKGRRIAYTFSLVLFFGSCVGLAQTNNYATLLVLRCLQSSGSASTISIGSGVIGDITTGSNRGGYMGIFQAGLLAPVAVGPIIGGAISQSLGWLAIFWFLSIYSGSVLLLLTLILPETLRSIIGDGSRLPSNIFIKYPLCWYLRRNNTQLTEHYTPAPKKGIDIFGPLHILISREAAPIIIFLAVYYAVWQMSITSMSTLFQDRYGLSETEVGLTFIANGVGSMVGTLVTGKLLDMDYSRVSAKYLSSLNDLESNNRIEGSTDAKSIGFPLEKARLRLVPIFSFSQCLSIIIFGWSIEYPDRIPIAIPIVCTFVTGWTAISTQSLIMTYLIDVFPDRSAAASASINLARCFFAAGGTSFIMPLVHSVGAGPAFTICMAIQVLALVGPFIQWKCAGRWRREAAERESTGCTNKASNRS